jgi:hypothetical protein
MPEDELFNSIILSIPQWYSAVCGCEMLTIAINQNSYNFYSHRKPTPALLQLLQFINNNTATWLSKISKNPTLSELGNVRQEIALEWLRIHNGSINWRKLFRYLETLRFRTFENTSVSINLVISSAQGTQDITDKNIEKILDPLASSPRAFFRVDHALRFISYEEIMWGSIVDTDDYKFHPEFLNPLFSVLKKSEYAVHLSQRGEIVILNGGGLLASYRKGGWQVYDVNTFKNSITSILGDYRVGCNIFEIMFDLSYRRHGALLVYDPTHVVLPNVINSTSLISSGSRSADAARAMLSADVRSIKMGNTRQIDRKKQLFLEVASIDGAVIFDKLEVLAIGAMINPHPSVGSHVGARTTAFQSAFLWGGMPVKVSSDGDISLLFKSNNSSGATCKSSLEFV